MGIYEGKHDYHLLNIYNKMVREGRSEYIKRPLRQELSKRGYELINGKMQKYVKQSNKG